MAITTLDGIIAAAKQRVQYQKNAGRVTVANGWFSLFDLTGQPGAGTLAIGNTANGVVPTDATAGYPEIRAFGASATGYVSRVEYGNTVACRLALYDRLFAAGAYAFNAATTLASIPSYSSRVPSTDYKGLEIWCEQVTAGTGAQAVSVGYTNAAGTAGRSTGATGSGAVNTVGRMWQLPLQAGDDGVSVVNSVTGSVATAGTFNVCVLRPLWSARINIANDGGVHDFLRTGLPQIFADSALFLMVNADSTSNGVSELAIDIING